MNQLSNAFSLLNLDVADSQDETQIEITNGDTDGVKGKGKENGTDGSPGEMKVLEHEKGDQKLESVGGECKLPLVWIDLEMTGLNIEVDRILEIACIVTNGNLTKSIEGPDLVIHQAKECLDNMGEWCQEHHAASGLTEKVLKSTVTEEEAEKQVIEFVKRNIGTYTPLLAGNSIYVDFQFLKCGKMHWGRCRLGSDDCYSCGRPGHIMRDFPSVHGRGRTQPSGSIAGSSASVRPTGPGSHAPVVHGRGRGRAPSTSGPQHRIYALAGHQDLESSPDVVTGRQGGELDPGP